MAACSSRCKKIRNRQCNSYCKKLYSRPGYYGNQGDVPNGCICPEQEGPNAVV